MHNARGYGLGLCEAWQCRVRQINAFPRIVLNSAEFDFSTYGVSYNKGNVPETKYGGSCDFVAGEITVDGSGKVTQGQYFLLIQF